MMLKNSPDNDIHKVIMLVNIKQCKTYLSHFYNDLNSNISAALSKCQFSLKQSSFGSASMRTQKSRNTDKNHIPKSLNKCKTQSLQ